MGIGNRKNIAVDVELHQKIRIAVARTGETISDFTVRALEAALALARKNGRAKS